MIFVVRGWVSSLETYHWSGLRSIDGDDVVDDDDVDVEKDDDEEGL